jgi:pyruvate/2-oxoglutarate/acetoin dehydrogenase E1 component
MMGRLTRGQKLGFQDCAQFDVPLLRVTGLAAPVPHSQQFEERFLPGAEKISVAARELAKY